MSTPTGPAVADALRAEGSEVTLADGTTVQIRYSLDSMKHLEKVFGSVKSLTTTFEEIIGSLDGGKAGQRGVFEALTTFLAAGFRHIRYVHPDTGEVIRLGRDEELVGELLDLRHMREYILAFKDAFGEAVGPTTPQVVAPPVPGPAAPLSPPTPGPGASGGTSPSTSGTFGQPISGT